MEVIKRSQQLRNISRLRFRGHVDSSVLRPSSNLSPRTRLTYRPPRKSVSVWLAALAEAGRYQIYATVSVLIDRAMLCISLRAPLGEAPILVVELA